MAPIVMCFMGYSVPSSRDDKCHALTWFVTTLARRAARPNRQAAGRDNHL
jgi:hypothetical protein